MARAISLGTILALLFAFVFQIAFAAPTECNSISDHTSACNIDLDIRDLLKRYSGNPRGKVGTGGPAKSDYPSDEEIRKAYLKPSGPHIFYSGIGADTTDPYAFSQKVGGVILRNAFPKKYLNQNKRSEEWLGDFWDRTSGIFAELAPLDNAYIVSEFHKDTIQDCSIWTRIESPTLKAKATIKTITLVDRSNFDNKKVIYTKSQSKREAKVPITKPVPAKRVKACDGAVIDTR